ncbi:kaempferol 3-O-beta-D-galactosyltransferase [Tanacetum coccineum]
MADEMNIPWVAFWTAGASSLSAHFYTDLIREKTAELKGSVRPEDEIADLIPGLSKVRLGDLPSGVVFGNIESPFSTMLHKMGRTLPRATAVPLNSFQDLDPDLTKNLSSNFKNFLNIVFKPPPHEIVELAEALEETKTPFLWSISKDSEKHFPQGFLERISANGTGKVVPWAPTMCKVLEHFTIGVFVTHGGWNSVLESIGVGVPMICRPFIGDQQINTCMIERVWEIGVRIEGGTFTKDGTRRALEQVLSADGLSKK